MTIETLAACKCLIHKVGLSALVGTTFAHNIMALLPSRSDNHVGPDEWKASQNDYRRSSLRTRRASRQVYGQFDFSVM